MCCIPFPFLICFLCYPETCRNITWTGAITHSIDDSAIHNGIRLHVNGQHKLRVGRRNGDGQMVDNYWYFGFVADSIVVHVNRWHCVCHTKLERFTVDCVVAMVRVTSFLVNKKLTTRLHILRRHTEIIRWCISQVLFARITAMAAEQGSHRRTEGYHWNCSQME